MSNNKLGLIAVNDVILEMTRITKEIFAHFVNECLATN